MNHPIKYLRFYQSVPLNGMQLTYFTPAEYMTVRKDETKALHARIHDKGVIIESETEAVLVSWNNIASCTFDKTVVLDGKKSSKPVDFRNI